MNNCKHKSWFKIISLVVACLFLVNDIASALGPAVASSITGDELRPGTKPDMYALGQKLFAVKRGPGAIDVDSYKPVEFTGTAPETEDITFVPAKHEDIPEGWEKFATKDAGTDAAYTWQEFREKVKADTKGRPLPEHFLQLKDLIIAFRFFTYAEAQIPAEKLDIQEGYFEVDEAKGELPIARIEQHGDKYVLVIHTKFVQMWNHIRANDVWFETDIDGQKRTVSVLPGVYSIVSQNMR